MRANSAAPGAHASAGATVQTRCGRQARLFMSSGTDEAAKLARCTSRLAPPGFFGTHKGARSTRTPFHVSEL